MKNIHIKHLTVAAFSLLSVACSMQPDITANDAQEQLAAQSPAEQAHQRLKVATWNMEHLAHPIDTGCRPRSSGEIEKLRQYVSAVDADIYGLQEVASEAAIRQVFPADQWDIILSARPDSEPYVCRESGFTSTQQKVALAVRKSVDVSASAQAEAFALDEPGLRYGVSATINTASGPLDILSLHLKSGCFVDDYRTSDTPACQMLSRQIPVLQNWVKERQSNNRRFLVLGDFNHRLSAPYNRFTRDIAAMNQPDFKLDLATEELIGCHPRYPAPIDHILAGGLENSPMALEAAVHPFNDMREDAMLSDHCAVSVTFKPKDLPLSSAVKWQVNSKEYEFITRSVYQQAREAVPSADTLNNPPWVVVMDLDETVLDNSSYQVMLDKTGQQYTPQSWNSWVMSEKATLVPGAKAFIEHVLAQGGKLAFITNRDKHLDNHTWANLKQLGLPVATERVCLMGRTEADKAAIDGAHYINDKDLRRQQVTEGSADCYTEEGQNLDAWQQLHEIVMQVGDNIEDISGVTQHNADVSELLSQPGQQYFILPNPMYGSWF